MSTISLIKGSVFLAICVVEHIIDTGGGNPGVTLYI